MISNSDDSVLRQDMPAALAKVEEAARLLVEASAISRTDPTSKVARTKLIEGSRYLGLGWTQLFFISCKSSIEEGHPRSKGVICSS